MPESRWCGLILLWSKGLWCRGKLPLLPFCGVLEERVLYLKNSDEVGGGERCSTENSSSLPCSDLHFLVGRNSVSSGTNCRLTAECCIIKKMSLFFFVLGSLSLLPGLLFTKMFSYLPKFFLGKKRILQQNINEDFFGLLMM